MNCICKICSPHLYPPYPDWLLTAGTTTNVTKPLKDDGVTAVPYVEDQ